MPDKPMMLFVDAQNLTNSASNYEPGMRVDCIELKKLLSEGYDLIRAYWFDSYPTEEQIARAEADDDLPNLSNKSGFFYKLDMNGYRVDADPLRWRDGQLMEKGADIKLATEMIAQGFNDSYEVATVVTGDADFERSIRYAQNQGKIVRIASFENSISNQFKKLADEYVSLDDIADDIRQ